MKYEDWQIKPWTTDFIVGKTLSGYKGQIANRYTVYVGEWVDAWWRQFYAHLEKTKR